MTDSPVSVDAITLFVEDLELSKSFYQDAFGLPVFFEDANSAVFKFANTLINLLAIPAAISGRSRNLCPEARADGSAPALPSRDALALLQAHTRTAVEGRGRAVSRAIHLERRPQSSLRGLAAVARRTLG